MSDFGRLFMYRSHLFPLSKIYTTNMKMISSYNAGWRMILDLFFHLLQLISSSVWIHIYLNLQARTQEHTNLSVEALGGHALSADTVAGAVDARSLHPATAQRKLLKSLRVPGITSLCRGGTFRCSLNYLHVISSSWNNICITPE